MKRLYFNIKDRKVLTLGLCLILVCVFTLTVAYAALNSVLTIQGNAEITASTWDIHLENPVVKSGSVTADVPTITSGRTLTFNTTLNMPGDYYEFTVDVVNAGTIDAMIDKITKTPELTTEQAKYLKYEVSYANGESISAKQNIGAGVTMLLKVRVEYRKDLSNGDLPTGQVVLNLSLVLDYIQSDGSGSSVKDNGVYDPYAIGNEKCLGSECFYIVGTEEDNVKLLSMMNITLDEEPKQSLSAETTAFSSDSQKGTNYSDYNGSIVEGYVNKYKNEIEKIGVEVKEARLITYGELKTTFACVHKTGGGSCETSYSWIYSTSFWTGSNFYNTSIYFVGSDNIFNAILYSNNNMLGVRPVIVISKDYFE